VRQRHSWKLPGGKTSVGREGGREEERKRGREGGREGGREEVYAKRCTGCRMKGERERGRAYVFLVCHWTEVSEKN